MAANTEADTCRKYVLPKLYSAGWTDDQINEQRYFTDGRIVTLGRSHYRRPGKKVDYLLRYNPDTIYKWIERKRLPAHKVGRLWKFKATEVDEWVRQGKAAEDTGKD
ncbi:MAG: excisionase family DNA-binding protein [Verrucomicrobiia bacterium]